LLLSTGRRRALDRGLARAIFVDTSASMRRLTPNGLSALDSARRAARALAGDAQASIIVEAAKPTDLVGAAAAWLALQGRRSELILVSDFQRGAVDTADLATLRPDIGLTFVRVPVSADSLINRSAAAGGHRINVRTAFSGDETRGEWSVGGAAPLPANIILLGADSDAALLSATRTAAMTRALPLPIDTTRAIAIVFPNEANRGVQIDSARPRFASWMIDAMTRPRVTTEPIRYGVTMMNGRQQLALFTNAKPGSPESARLVSEAYQATSISPPPDELEPQVLSDAELSHLRRPVSDAPGTTADLQRGPSDGRWCWMAALLLLLVESRLRRKQPARNEVATAENARAA
jgi:hypothetical protein